jgi:hypothetical protein
MACPFPSGTAGGANGSPVRRAAPGVSLCQRAILAALDRINARHGPGMIYLAASHAVRDTAPMRIAFTHIPEPSLEDNTPSTHAQR